MAEAIDLATLADVKEWLGITDSSSDALLGRLITAASQDFVNEILRPDITPDDDYTERFFRSQDFHSYCGHGAYYRCNQRQLFLKNYPVNSIALVTVNGTAIDLLSDPSTGSGYWFDPDAAPENRQSIYLLGESCGGFYTGFADYPYSFVPNVVVEYNGGYEEVPPAISQAVIELVAFKRGESQLQGANQTGGAVTIGTYSEQGGNVEMTLAALEANMPVGVQRVIDQYRRAVI